MAAYVIADIDVTDPEAYERYKALAGPSVEAAGGRYIVRGGAVTTLEGPWQPTRVVLLEFPSVEAAEAWYEGEQYKAARDVRRGAANMRMVIVAGV